MKFMKGGKNILSVVCLGCLVVCMAGMLSGCGTAAGEVASFSTPERTAVTVTEASKTTTPVFDLLTINDTSITGVAGAVEGGATVKVYDANSVLLYTVSAAQDGSFTVTIGTDDMYCLVSATSEGELESEFVPLLK